MWLYFRSAVKTTQKGTHKTNRATQIWLRFGLPNLWVLLKGAAPILTFSWMTLSGPLP